MSRPGPRLAASEDDVVARLRSLFGGAAPGVVLGIGDDAAVLAPNERPWVVSVDASVEGVHFDRRWLDPEAIGFRSFQAAVSDLAAMGAQPVAALSSLIVVRGESRRWLEALTRGQKLASQRCGCPVVGGNLSRGGELSVTTTVLGVAGRPLGRAGARAGDQLWLVGRLGLAAAGLSWLRLGRPLAGGAEACVEAWRRPRALVARGLELGRVASACIDVSDGLARDVRRLARASGVAIVVQRGRLSATLEPTLRDVGRRLRRSPLPWVLRGGEDYALLATGRAADRPAWARAIGYVKRGRGAFLQWPSGCQPLAGGYDHLAE